MRITSDASLGRAGLQASPAWTRSTPPDVGGVWPFRTIPKEDESFSSWVTRAAHAQWLSLYSLCDIIEPSINVLNRDLDRNAPLRLLVRFSQGTGAPIDLAPMTILKRYEGVVYETDNPNGKLLWLPTAASLTTNKSFGQQLCPRCLAEDKSPYFRLTWRLAFVTHCPKHRVSLIDRCLQCKKPIFFVRAKPSVDSITCCVFCGFDFRNAKVKQISAPNRIAFQTHLLSTVTQGWAVLGTYGPQYSLAYFWILYRLYRLLIADRCSEKLRHTTIERAALNDRLYQNLPKLKDVEIIGPFDRGCVLEMAQYLITDWPDRFVGCCKAAGIWGLTALRHAKRPPFAIWHPVTMHLDGAAYRPTAGEIECVKAHLKRKGLPATYHRIRTLLGTEFQSLQHMADPAANHEN